MSNNSSTSFAAHDANALRESDVSVPPAIDITVNGHPVRLAAGSNIADLMASLNRPARGVAVAVNREVVPRRIWAERALNPGDRIDLVNAIGGG